MGDGGQQGLVQPHRLLDGLLEVHPRLGQAADVAEQRTEVDVDAGLAELVAGLGQHLEGGFVLDLSGVELALLVEDDPALQVGVTEGGAAHLRLGHVEDGECVGQLALVGDDERQGRRDAPGQREVVEGGRCLPGMLEVGAGGP